MASMLGPFMLLSLTILISIGSYFFGNLDYLVTTAFIGLSLTSLIYTIVLYTPKKSWNNDLYNIIKYSKKLKVMQIKKTIYNKNGDNNKGGNNGGNEYVETSNEIEFIDDSYSKNKVINMSDSNMKKIGALSTLGFINVPSYAHTIKSYCCKYIEADIGSIIKIDSHKGSFEYIRMNSKKFETGPTETDYYIDDKYHCSYSTTCNNVYYFLAIKAIKYILVIALLALVARILWFISKIFREPVSTKSIETTIGQKKITDTKYKYMSKFRAFQVTSYVLCFTATIWFLVSMIMNVPNVEAMVTFDRTVTNNGTYYDCYYDDQSFYTTCYEKYPPDIDNYEKKWFTLPDSINCTVNPVEYALYGNWIAKCIYDSNNNHGILTEYDRSEELFRRVDELCFSISNIRNAKMGRSACVKACKLRENVPYDCYIEHNPNNEFIVKSFKRKSHLDIDMTGFDNSTYKPVGLIADEIEKEVYAQLWAEIRAKENKMNAETTTPIAIKSTTVSTTTPSTSDEGSGNHSRKKRAISMAGDGKTLITKYIEGDYDLPAGFVTQFSTGEQYGGSVFIAEKTTSKYVCPEKNPSTVVAVCSTGRRQIISCEPNLVGEARIAAETFTCKKPVNMASIPEWRLENPPTKIRYDNDELLAGEFTVDKFTATVIKDTGISNPIEVSVSYARRDQDTRQQTGGLKYFVYSFLTTIKCNPNFVSDLKYITRRLTQVDNSMTEYKMYRFPGNDARQPGLISMFSNFLTIDTAGTKISKNMRQDLSLVNYVVKMDIFDTDGSKITDREKLCTTDDTGFCNIVVPVYYAFRIYGPMKASIRLFGKQLENIYVMPDTCSSVNTIKVNGICYFPDFNYVSTDVIASGYPMTQTSIVAFDSSLPDYEIPSFYTNHPKIGSGQYMGKVSSSANIGYYSMKGKCNDIHMNPNSKLMECDGKPAINIEIVKYTTFHRPLTSEPNCIVNNNTVVCRYNDPTRVTKCDHKLNTAKHYDDVTCIVNVTKEMSHSMKEHSSVVYRTHNSHLQLHRGQAECTFCAFVMLQESYYRCSYCIILVICTTGLGFIILLTHYVLVNACYINSYTIGRLMRKIGITVFLTGFTVTPKCDCCKMYIYNATEEKKHRHSCPIRRCPYCIFMDANKDLCQLEFSTASNYVEHMKIHSNMRRNPMKATLSTLRCRVVLYTIVYLLASGKAVQSLHFDHDSAMRNRLIGSNITIPEDFTTCNSQKCGVAKSYRASLPLTHGSALIVQTINDGVKYAAKIVIKNPRMTTQCLYKYTAATGLIGGRHISYACKGNSECKMSPDDFMKPINGHKGPEFIPFDVYNPLKGAFCPKSLACLSPIVGITWISAGCMTINDGTAIGTEYYTPSVTDDMIHVFECQINSISYDHCDSQSCSSVSSEKSSIESGNIGFEHINQQLPRIFNIGALSKQGATVPEAIVIGMPQASDDSDPYLSYRMTKIPTGETCLEGTSFEKASCSISTASSSPSLNCKSKLPHITLSETVKRYDSLIEQYHCNIENTRLSWQTKVVPRQLTINEKLYNDTQTYSWPSIVLTMDYCSLGMTTVDLVSMSSVKMEQVKYTGTVTKVKCTGLYNRNHMTKLVFDIENKEGMFEFHCPGVFSEVCLINTETSNTCNVTTMLPLNNTCYYNGKAVYTDCTNLEYSEPDPTSSTHGFITGSDSINTWTHGFRIFFHSWWGITSITVTTILLVILLFWVIKLVAFMCKSRASIRAFTKSINVDSSTEPLVIDKDNFNNYYRTNNIRKRTNNRNM